jgi:two-component system OmpR family response regulator
MRILVVEDDRDLNAQLAHALRDAGYVVDSAFDGEEGHFMGDSEPYDAVILDIGLPRMDGLSVLEQWRRDGRTMPVLLLTARDRWSDKVQGIDAGADDYVAKPFHVEEVLARVRALVRRAPARFQHTCLGAAQARPEGQSRHGRGHADQAYLARIQGARIPHAPPGKVISRTELTEHLYDQDFDRDSNTIEVFVGRCAKSSGST